MARNDFEDDGRTIADMSGVERRALFIPRIPKRRRDGSPESGTSEAPGRDDAPHLTDSERGAAVRGALAAALALWLVFIVCGALLIWFLTKVW